MLCGGIVVLEIYLFINPIGSKCYRSEQNIIKLVDQLSTDVKFRFIPFLNLNTVTMDVS
ncbi:DsbA family protein [Liquorilactobacillus satsumensis]|uniref:DsbA family protein n=1 Tax=Liquorilactobacillus satsumensis TaxID=259059 RepID=UPI0039EC940C